MKVWVLEAKADDSWYVQGVFKTWDNARSAAIANRKVEYEDPFDEDLFYTRICCSNIEFLITAHEVR